ncbi:hypothetical protein B5S28_g3672 [[Candida] boidinii]|uniref:Unnamed protein product n=1 Tax=Candida boidinii TaxID=5477 RepID=A0ACB5TGN4_CANBO|nr:hypothetical protein B5S28_g3672 [[Candida] boidinii]OWB61783.1 hypothetical protein B5S29_g2686 [[Candida] boidinii]OWB72492.1 hypothetical protein B5S31_g2206 [[Candida] boidinii]OWB78445.1 hypothetical protein B5S32_g2639 [[Candida] boidinii]GME88364.1 unnamed protein product [[Candida] boidinii]
MTTLEKAPKLLSIQSHVVHGYVGNKAATFPLQVMGWDVNALNTVNFSNHTGYGSFEGSVTSGDEIRQIYKGLKEIDVKYDAILTGYIHGAPTVKAVGEICCEIKDTNPSTFWLLDPVMGDEGQLYVKEDVIPEYRKILQSKLVDVITPNHFEVELLLGSKITDKKSLLESVNRLHKEFAVKHVVISSLNLTECDLDVGGEENENERIIALVSSFNPLFDEKPNPPVLFKINKIDSYFTGVGDLFSALLIDRIYKKSYKNHVKHSSNILIESANESLSVMSEVLSETTKITSSRKSRVKGKIGSADTMKDCELKIIECQSFYNNSNQKYNPIELM